MVLALLAFVPGRGRTRGRARHCRRSRDLVAVSTALRARTGEAPAQTPQGNERLLAGGQNLRAGEEPMALLVPGGGSDRRDPRLSPLGQAGRAGGSPLSGQSLGPAEPPQAPG
jgi:hypothetical protein